MNRVLAFALPLMLLCVLSCGGDRPARFDEEPPRLIIRLPSGAMPPDLAGVRMVLAPMVRYDALVEPSISHMKAAVVPRTGTLFRVDSTRHVDSGVVVAELREGSGRTINVTAPAEGLWRPRRTQGQFVLWGDTVGLLVEHGYWQAVGQVEDIDVGVVHAGDSARVRLRGDTIGRPGRVELVRAPGSAYRYYAEVGVAFVMPENLMRPGARFATVDVLPSGATDSLLAVPTSSVLALRASHVVFLASGTGTFEARFVFTGPRVGDLTVIRNPLLRDARVAISGLQPLASIALDSLIARERAGQSRR